MSFQKYPAYKDSGVEWLGEVPMHWGVKATKRLFRVVGGLLRNLTTTRIGMVKFYGLRPLTLVSFGRLQSRALLDASRRMASHLAEHHWSLQAV